MGIGGRRRAGQGARRRLAPGLLVPGFLTLVLLGACSPSAQAPGACLTDLALPDPARPTAGMVAITGGVFAMGAAGEQPEEGPPRQVRVGDFWIDQTEVTNAAFARFVEATGHVTQAEQPLPEADYPGLSAEDRAPASLVFVGAGAAGGNPAAWWRIIPGASWRHPEGPGSTIRGKDAWPVVHIGWADALAYARWLGRDLPTEAEWEYAARGGLAGARYAWGDAPPAPGEPLANTWQGIFPVADTGDDGHKATAAPVGCFPANGFGLYDITGNVWEWTSDWYRPGLVPASVLEQGGPSRAMSHDPDEPGRPKHVIKGGSFLCADNFCFRYRPAARAPGPPDSGASHVGFRTVFRAPAPPPTG